MTLGGSLRAGRPEASLARAMAAAFVIAVAASALGIGVRATFGAHVAVDETQYVLTAISLAEDRDLDISDELAAERWRAFADVEPPRQTEVLADGREISPHDPLLSLVLAVPVGVAGWIGAKLALAVIAGMLAALTVWTAVRRFGVPLSIAAPGMAIAAASAPLAVYGQQIYPELPAAAVTLAGVAALTGPLRRRNLMLVGLAVTALPWLSVKYVPVAVAVAVVALVRWWHGGARREALGFAGALGVLGVAYLGVHRLVWGGWTAYASGDHFQSSGEFGAVGFDPNYIGRALRLVGLLVDREYGIATWQPAWLLVVPAVAMLIRHEAVAAMGSLQRSRQPRDFRIEGPSVPPGVALGLPLITGWLVATFIAVTMHGFWWPGRQLVVVLPLALIVVLRWAASASRRARIVGLALGVVGVFSYLCLLVDGYTREITWVSGFQRVDNVLYQAYDALLPDYRGDFWALHVVWVAVLIALLALGARTARRVAWNDGAVHSTLPTTDEPSARTFEPAATFSRKGPVKEDQRNDR